jgi:hypothetical protein
MLDAAQVLDQPLLSEFLSSLCIERLDYPVCVECQQVAREQRTLFD